MKSADDRLEAIEAWLRRMAIAAICTALAVSLYVADYFHTKWLIVRAVEEARESMAASAPKPEAKPAAPPPVEMHEGDTVWLVPSVGEKTAPVRIGGREIELPGFMKVILRRADAADGRGGMVSEVEIIDGPHHGRRAMVKRLYLRATT